MLSTVACLFVPFLLKIVLSVLQETLYNKKKKKNAHKFASSQKEISTENNDNIYMDSAKARGILLSDEELKGIIYWL